MPKETNAAMTQVSDIKLPIRAKECEICGGKYIPTSNRQKYCQACAGLMKKSGGDKEKAKAKARYERQCMPGEVKIIVPKSAEAGSGRNSAIETPAPLKQPEKPEEAIRKTIETPEQGTWYEARITRGKDLMLAARIHPDMLAMIIKEVR